MIFFMEKIEYLGHIIDEDGRGPDPEWILCFNGISTFIGYLMPKPFS